MIKVCQYQRVRDWEMWSQGRIYSLPPLLKAWQTWESISQLFRDWNVFILLGKKWGLHIYFFSIRLSLTSVMVRRISFYLRDLFFSFKSLYWNLIELSFNNIWLRITRDLKTGNYFSVISGIINSKVSMKIGVIQIDGCKI